MVSWGSVFCFADCGLLIVLFYMLLYLLLVFSLVCCLFVVICYLFVVCVVCVWWVLSTGVLVLVCWLVLSTLGG